MPGSLFEAVLVLHVAGGTRALAAGPAAMLLRKGGQPHRLSGRVYAGAMTATAFSALVLAIATRNALLLMIAVFSQFLVFTGWRALRQRRLHEGGHGARWFDWLAAVLTLAFSVGLFAAAWSGDRDVTELFFGVGGSVLAVRGMLQLTGRGVRNGDWPVRHMVGMSAAYLATVNAFAVVTLTMLPRPVAFIGPTLIGTPLIAWITTRLTLSLRQKPAEGEIPGGPAAGTSHGPIMSGPDRNGARTGGALAFPAPTR